MKSIIKWPGGKTRFLKSILPQVPDHGIYYEPFLGSGALFFKLEPKASFLNDISGELISFYESVKRQDPDFFSILNKAAAIFHSLGVDDGMVFEEGLENARESFMTINSGLCEPDFPLFDFQRYYPFLLKHPNLPKRTSTRLKSAFYYLARAQYNEIRKSSSEGPYSDALFFLVRELCFGSMFRYNSGGLFNIPYGGFSYDNKDVQRKVGLLKEASHTGCLQNARFSRSDFRDFMGEIAGEGAFVFLDPPYDSSFSSYTGNEFGKKEHEDLKDILSGANYKFMLVLSRTDFMERLYEGLGLNTTIVPSSYTYSMRGRNDRNVDYLVLRNY